MVPFLVSKLILNETFQCLHVKFFVSKFTFQVLLCTTCLLLFLYAHYIFPLLPLPFIAFTKTETEEAIKGLNNLSSYF